ncbi:S1 domain-containing RNA-binding protein [Longirhabdus pacifica]|uniref:S1 domain-containing RNA-binding protein n=1 Tax=Longirhabdus pacifica TaxID=2305227 RepID=UPI00100918AB|nr:S1 domain-containing RNA-binding protein [Longirhabdus pacifica]
MSIEVGSKLDGKVTGITKFGAFVELPGGETGLVHISEIADSYVKDINEHLKVNDKVVVKVIQVDNGKIGLSIRKAVDKPKMENTSPRPQRSERPPRDRDRSFSRNNNRRGGGDKFQTFEDKMSRFLKDSEERISSLKKHTESKRGGKGAKRF